MLGAFGRGRSQVAFYGLALAIFCGLVFVYWRGLKGGFFFDDFANILESGEIQLKDFSANSLLNLWDSGIAGPLGRPISLLSFALNYYFSGFEPFFFKLTNVILHCVNGVLVYVLARLLVRALHPSMAPNIKCWFAFSVAALWALHPIQITSVLYVVQRMTSLSAFFALAALSIHIWARQRSRHLSARLLPAYLAAWAVLFPLSLLSKETGVIFVLYVAAYEAILHKNFIGRIDGFGRWYLGLLVFAAAVVSLYLAFNPGFVLQGYGTRQFTLTQRLLTESRIYWQYASLILFPTLPRMGLYHDDVVLSTSFVDPIATIASIVGLLSCLLLTWIWKARCPLITFAVLWFTLGHILESSIFALELMHEHRNYLPSLGLVFLIVGVAFSVRQILSQLSTVMVVGLLAVAAYWGLITFLRADMYGSDYRRTQIEAEYHPNSVRSQYEAGAVLVNMVAKQPDPILRVMAEKHFERVNQLDPSYKLGIMGMLQLDCLFGHGARDDLVKSLSERIANTKWNRLDRTVMHGVADMSNEHTLCLNREQVDRLFESALSNPDASMEDHSVVRSDYVLYLWLGQRDYSAARQVLLDAINENKNDVLNRMNLLQLSRFFKDTKMIGELVEDLNARMLTRQERVKFQAIISEL